MYNIIKGNAPFPLEKMKGMVDVCANLNIGQMVH